MWCQEIVLSDLYWLDSSETLAYQSLQIWWHAQGIKKAEGQGFDHEFNEFGEAILGNLDKRNKFLTKKMRGIIKRFVDYN